MFTETLVMGSSSVAILIYGEASSGRNALTEEKYKDLAAALTESGFLVESVLYHDEAANTLFQKLSEFDAILVWVNPIEQGRDRKKLDALLSELDAKGCFVSSHPDVILKMGTKDVLFTTRNMDWGSDIKIYSNYEDFRNRFPISAKSSKARVLKQYRGNGGNGVYKINFDAGKEMVTVIHAKGNEKKDLSPEAFYNEFRPLFANGSVLIDQEWNENIANGMVRCYLSGKKVAGFGYQEINALYELKPAMYIPPGQRFYFTGNCGLFSDLKYAMEIDWVPQMQKILSVSDDMLPVIWDADFFINRPNSDTAKGKYTLCEINVSSVSPFPPSAIKFMVEQVYNGIKIRAGQ